MQRHLLGIQAVNAERMEIGTPDTRPVPELDAELERAPRGAQEVVFVETECLIELPDRGNRRFTDADGADLRRLDDIDTHELRLQTTRENRGGHPASGAAPDDGDAADRLAHVKRSSGILHCSSMNRRCGGSESTP